MKKFILIFFILSSVLSSLFYGLVVAVDPYNKLGNNLFGFKVKAVASARENKFNMLENSKVNYEAFILGSSSAHRYNTKTVEQITGFKTFNYALQSTTVEDYMAILRHIMSVKKPKLILLQMDFYVLNEHHKIDPRFYASPLKNYLNIDESQYFDSNPIDNNYLTLGAIIDSFRVIGANVLGQKEKHLYLADGNYKKEKKQTGKIKIYQPGDKEYKFSKTRIELLKEIKQICVENNIKILVWSSPRSLEHMRRLNSKPVVQGNLRKYKSILEEIFGRVSDFTSESISKYNTTEYFRDSTHPTFLLSDIVLKEVLRELEN